MYLEEPRSEAEARLLDEPVSAANLAAVRAGPYRNREDTLFDDEDLAVCELLLFRGAGGSTVVDQTLPDIGRDLEGLTHLARRTGLHIVAGCGYYLEKTHAPAVAKSTVEELAERLVAKLTADVAACGIPCGGVDPGRVAIAHVDAEIDPAYQTAIAARSAFVEYDFFGWGEIAATAEHFVPSDRERVAGVAELLVAGYRERVLLSQDVTRISSSRSTGPVATRARRATCRRCSRSTASRNTNCAGS